ncbi:MAG: hypothetical protein GY863_21215 [bacterium]|nr:hypothetical protein [bacterium]
MKFTKKILLLLFTLILSILITTGSALSQLTFRGYLENRFFTTVINNDFAPNHLENSLRTGNYNRARIIAEKDVSEQSSITLAVDYFTYHGYLLQFLRDPGAVSDSSPTSVGERISIDRAYMRLYFKRADVTIGKQLIFWGRSFLWSPFDVFNRVNFLEPREEKSGVNAVKVTIPTGDLSSIETVFEAGEMIKDSRAGIRMLFNWQRTDFAGTVLHNVTENFRQNIYGFDFKTDLLILTLSGEFARYSEEPVISGAFTPVDYYKFVIGADYSFNFGKMLLLMAEYSRDTNGASNKNDYDYSRRILGRSPFLGKDYLYTMAQIQYSDHLSFSLSSIMNLNDKGSLLMPSIRYSIFKDTEFTLGTYIPIADKGTEFNPPDILDPGNYSGNAIIYVWFKLFI